MRAYVQDGWTALMLASANGHTDVVRSLLSDTRVAVNLQNKVYSVFSVACILLTSSASAVRQFGWTALIYASRNNHADTVQALLADTRLQVNLRSTVVSVVLCAHS